MRRGSARASTQRVSAVGQPEEAMHLGVVCELSLNRGGRYLTVKSTVEVVNNTRVTLELRMPGLAASSLEGDREVARTLADCLAGRRRRAYYDAVQAARENGEPLPPPPPWLLREWRRRRDTFLLCRRRFYESKKRLESSSCWAFWPRLFERFDVIRAVAGPDAEDVYGHMVRYL